MRTWLQFGLGPSHLGIGRNHAWAPCLLAETIYACGNLWNLSHEHHLTDSSESQLLLPVAICLAVHSRNRKWLITSNTVTIWTWNCMAMFNGKMLTMDMEVTHFHPLSQKKTETEAVEKIGKQPPSQTQLAARASPWLLFANAQSTPSTRPETPTRFVLSTEDPPSGRSSLVAEAFQPPAPGWFDGFSPQSPWVFQ